MACGARAQEADKDLQLAHNSLQQTREQLAERTAAIKKQEQRLEATEATVAQLRREAVDSAGELARVRAGQLRGDWSADWCCDGQFSYGCWRSAGGLS